jgi:hypothetical protein
MTWLFFLVTHVTTDAKCSQILSPQFGSGFRLAGIKPSPIRVRIEKALKARKLGGHKDEVKGRFTHGTLDCRGRLSVQITDGRKRFPGS